VGYLDLYVHLFSLFQGMDVSLVSGFSVSISEANEHGIHDKHLTRCSREQTTDHQKKGSVGMSYIAIQAFLKECPRRGYRQNSEA
jgi:hypothetical protein